MSSSGPLSRGHVSQFGLFTLLGSAYCFAEYSLVCCVCGLALGSFYAHALEPLELALEHDSQWPDLQPQGGFVISLHHVFWMTMLALFRSSRTQFCRVCSPTWNLAVFAVVRRRLDRDVD